MRRLRKVLSIVEGLSNYIYSGVWCDASFPRREDSTHCGHSRRGRSVGSEERVVTTSDRRQVEVEVINQRQVGGVLELTNQRQILLQMWAQDYSHRFFNDCVPYVCWKCRSWK